MNDKNLKTQREIDVYWIKKTLRLADFAASRNEIPVGALIVQNIPHQPFTKGKLISCGWNFREQTQNPLAHAEIIAIDRASRHLGQWRLLNCTMYVTLEPCTMCAGALIQSRIERLVYACPDPKAGAIESVFQLTSNTRLNHKISSEVCEQYKDSASKQLKIFFSSLRQQKKNKK